MYYIWMYFNNVYTHISKLIGSNAQTIYIVSLYISI